jgi:PPOX class probable F420-dependent enzyme
MQRLPERAIELIKAPNFGYLATLMPDGSPQVTPVWVETDGTYVLVNTAKGRQKVHNLEHDKRVAIAITDHANPYTWVQIRGYVAEMTEEGAEELIHRLATKYLGRERYPLQPGERRVTIKIAPDHVSMSAA